MESLDESGFINTNDDLILEPVTQSVNTFTSVRVETLSRFVLLVIQTSDSHANDLKKIIKNLNLHHVTFLCWVWGKYYQSFSYKLN